MLNNVALVDRRKEEPHHGYKTVSVVYDEETGGNLPVVVEGVAGKTIAFFFTYRILGESNGGMQLLTSNTELAWCTLPADSRDLGTWVKLPMEWDYQFVANRGELAVGDWKVPKAKVVAIYYGYSKKKPSTPNEEVPWFAAAYFHLLTW